LGIKETPRITSFVETIDKIIDASIMGEESKKIKDFFENKILKSINSESIIEEIERSYEHLVGKYLQAL